MPGPRPLAFRAGSAWDDAGASVSDGRGFVYVAVCAGPEDLLKVGLSDDPVARWSAFHRRWFEAFDLDHSLLIQLETRREAQALETALHRSLREHNCPAPLSMRAGFGGGTEWYRGAYGSALAFAQAAQREGQVLHAPAWPWFARAMQGRAERLAGLIDQALHDLPGGAMTLAQYEALCDLVDAHCAFDAEVAPRFSMELAQLRRLRRETWPGP